jgi:hypothetical protein
MYRTLYHSVINVTWNFTKLTSKALLVLSPNVYFANECWWKQTFSLPQTFHGEWRMQTYWSQKANFSSCLINNHTMKAKRKVGIYLYPYQQGRYRGLSSIPGEVRKFLFSTSSNLTLPTQSPVRWVLEVLSRRDETAGAWSWTLHLVQRSRKHGSLQTPNTFP